MSNNQLTPKQQKGCGIGCLSVLAISAVLTILIVLLATKEEKLSAAELNEINETIANFEAKTTDYINATNGVVKSIKMQDIEKSNSFRIHVFIAESSWASASESEKSSVAATIGRQMKELASPADVFVYLKSYENNDTLAEPKISGDGYNIIR